METTTSQPTTNPPAFPTVQIGNLIESKQISVKRTLRLLEIMVTNHLVFKTYRQQLVFALFSLAFRCGS